MDAQQRTQVFQKAFEKSQPPSDPSEEQAPTVTMFDILMERHEQQQALRHRLAEAQQRERDRVNGVRRPKTPQEPMQSSSERWARVQFSTRVYRGDSGYRV